MTTSTAAPENTSEEFNYVAQRLRPQIERHCRESRRNRTWHEGLNIARSFCLAAAPVIGILSSSQQVPVMAALSGLGLLVDGISRLKKFQEKAIQGHLVSEGLRREEMFFYAAAGPYKSNEDEAGRKALLVERCEQILEEEQRNWASYLKEPKERAPAPSVSRP